jgi:carbon monoxide dehydrogenase subunit G
MRTVRACGDLARNRRCPPIRAGTRVALEERRTATTMRTEPIIAVTVMVIASITIPLRAADPSIGNPDVVVRESRGVYSVEARFHVDQPREIALAVLTDYEQIPRFMPGVESTVVIQRVPGRALIAQEATSRFMLFKKRVRLLLEIDETETSLAFRDQCGKSFKRYDGEWRLADGAGGTDIAYTLTAQPAFDVPEFVLKRLLQRDSGAMIDGLRREIARRARM